LAPIPNASVAMTAAVKAGVRARPRSGNLNIRPRRIITAVAEISYIRSI
jgi:hypothetical protein